jgi:Rifampin ADP-ribosyl transferase
VSQFEFLPLGAAGLPLGKAVQSTLYVVILKGSSKPMPSTDNSAAPRFYHGTRADLTPGDLIAVGYNSNFGTGEPLSWVYFAGTLDAAVWGAELAAGEGRERIYTVEPTGPIFDDPNLTDKKFPGNPTQSYRSREPLRVTGEVTEWDGHSPEQLREMKNHLEVLKAQGIEAID